MTDTIKVAQTIRLREAGLDEYWLQEQIVANPSWLGLGDLEVIAKERQQASGGRLDILLKDPEDDEMYEVEVMLGDTDETHIVRTIEYWDNEKRKWPQRQHFAVLVAESITRRFFNVIQLFSHSIPIIAIQVNLIDRGNEKLLHFSKVLDTYEEPEDGVAASNEAHDEEYWKTKAPWTLDAAKALLEVVNKVYGNSTLNFVKNYIAIVVNNNNYLWLHKRSGNKSLLGFWLGEDLLQQGGEVLDSHGISYVKKTTSIRITIDKAMISSGSDTFVEIAKLVKKAWSP